MAFEDWALTWESDNLKVSALALNKRETRGEHVKKLHVHNEAAISGYYRDLVELLNEGPAEEWKPFAVRQMKPLAPLDCINTHYPAFTKEFLIHELGGEQWSHSFFFVPKGTQVRHGVKAYWLMDAQIEPYLPDQPAAHGAKLTPFFNETLTEPGYAPTVDDYMNAPVFIKDKGESKYRYYGHYSQTRFSDRLDYDRMNDGTVPEFVLNVWAKVLTSPNREAWVTEELIDHFWPKPTYEGLMPLEPGAAPPKNDGITSVADYDLRMNHSMHLYMLELRKWRAESKLKAAALTEADILTAFRATDTDYPAGLRLHWEYLECSEYREDFYATLLKVSLTNALQRGYKKHVAIQKKKGYTWQHVPATSASGHPTTKVQLVAPKKKKAVRKDSVVDDRAMSVPLAADNKDGAAKPTTPAKTALTPEEKYGTALPPHIRARQAAKEKAEQSKAPTPAQPTSETVEKPSMPLAPHQRVRQAAKKKVDWSKFPSLLAGYVPKPEIQIPGEGPYTRALRLAFVTPPGVTRRVVHNVGSGAQGAGTTAQKDDDWWERLKQCPWKQPVRRVGDRFILELKEGWGQ